MKRIELVRVSPLIRRLLTRQLGSTTIEAQEEPVPVIRSAEPYTCYEKSSPDENGKSELVAKTGYHKTWYEWSYRRMNRKRVKWLPSGPEQSDIWRPAGLIPGQRNQFDFLLANAIILGRITWLGPTLDSFLTSDQVSKGWKTTIIEHFAGDNLAQKSMVALCQRLHDIIASKAAAASLHSIAAFMPPNSTAPTRDTHSARLFIGSNGFLGVASPGASLGDQIVQFWKSTTAAITQKNNHDSTFIDYSITGRCSIVMEGYSLQWDAPQDITKFQGTDDSHIFLPLDLNTLVALTLDSYSLDD